MEVAMVKKILIVDDDPMLSELIGYNLEQEGYTIVRAEDGDDGLRQFQTEQPDLVILDVTMPKRNGWEVCERIRAVSDTPVMMLTAQGREEDIVRGLDLGADDYLTKPFRLRVLLARIRAALRRTHLSLEPEPQVTYTDDYLVINLADRRVTVGGEITKLTPTEYKLLAFLVENKGRILTFRQILENVWGFEYIDDIDYLRVYIWHLRKKIEQNSKNPVYLLNELSTGYRFEPQK
jgi:two-component system, OmpR family, KDP operon response regulator KdpE